MISIDRELNQTNLFEVVVQTIRLCIDSNSGGGREALDKLFNFSLFAYISEVGRELNMLSNVIFGH